MLFSYFKTTNQIFAAALKSKFTTPQAILPQAKRSRLQFLQILKLLLQILKVEEGEIYSPAPRIHAVTDFPVRCLNAALKVL